MLYKGRACLSAPHSQVASHMLPTATLLLGLAGTALGFNTCQSISDEVSSGTDIYYPGEYQATSRRVWLSSGRIFIIRIR